MIWSLYMVFLGVTLPDLAFKPDSTYLPFFEGHENNAHCLAVAITSLPGAIFAYYGDKEQKDRMKEFLVVSTLTMKAVQLLILDILYVSLLHMQTVSIFGYRKLLTFATLQFTSSRIMTLAKETEKEKDAPKAREAIYLLLDLVSRHTVTIA